MTSDQPQPQYSPDGKWAWDGHSWRPVALTPVWGAPQPAPYPQSPFPPQSQYEYQYQQGPYGPPPYQQRGPARPRVDNRFAWVLALAPLGSIVLFAILALGGLDTWPIFLVGSIALLVADVVSAVADARRLRAAGVPASTALAILVVPVYLFIRASRVGSYAIPVAWCAISLASFIGTFVLIPSFGVVVDTSLVERSIERAIERQTGTSVDVQCAGFLLVKPGENFQCSGTTDHGSDFIVDITLQNDDGDILWEVRGGGLPRGSALG